MAGISVSAPGALVVAVSFERKALLLAPETITAVRRYGGILEARVKGNAHGRPGPRIITGDYNRSINLQTYTLGSMFVADVGTNADQGRRLEYGFVGVDSLGRHYNQPPYPHFRPALDLVAPQFIAALEALAVAP